MKRVVFGRMKLALAVIGMLWCASAEADDFSAWTHQMKIQFAGYNPPGGGALSNFPALVVLNTNMAGFSYGDFNNTNADLRFAANDKTTPLNFEVETWDTNAAPAVSAPSDVANLQLWLTASTGVTTNGSGQVSVWADQSGHSYSATQTVAGYQPTWVANALNGQPVIRFTSANSQDLDLGNISAGFPSAATLFIVVSLNNSASANYDVFDTQASLGTLWRYTVDGKCYAGMFRAARLSGFPLMPTNGVHVFTVASSSSAWEMWQDGVSFGAQGASYGAGNDYRIGALSQGTYHINGDIAEIIIYSRALTVAEQSRVGLYLAQKYGVSSGYQQRGNSYVWVQVPQLADSNTTIWAFWGQNGAAIAPCRTNGSTWSTNTFGAVWHMDQTNAPDSTANGANGASVNGNISLPGIVGNAQCFNEDFAANQYLNMGNPKSLQIPGDFTLSFWLYKFDTATAGLMSKFGDAYYWDLISQKNNFYINSTFAWQTPPGASTYPSRQWIYLTAEYRSVDQSVAFYANGAPDGVLTFQPTHGTNGTVYIATQGGNNPLAGLMDEVRYESVVRPLNWVWANYMTMASNNVMTRYTVTTVGGPTVTDQGGATNVTATTASLQGYLASTGSAPTTVTVYWGPSDGGPAAGNWAYTNAMPGYQVPGALSTNISGLTANTPYYYRYYATNSVGDFWADAASFVTLANFVPWARKMKITFPGYNPPGGGTLTNFPALVVFTNGVGGFKYSDLYNTNADLRFADSNESVVLNYEIETWNTNGASYVWVQVPTLSSSNDYIYAYWKKSGQTAPAYTTNGATWSAGYKAVLHLATTNDSSPNRYNATNVTGATSLPAAGRIGNGWNFTSANSDSLMFPVVWAPAKFTLSWWIKPTTIVDFNQQMSGGSWSQFYCHTTATGPGGLYIGTDQTTRFGPGDTGGNVYQAGAWSYVTFTFDSGTAALYKGGQLLCSKAMVAPTTAWYYFLLVGGQMNGVLDEMEISTLARSSNWIWACFMNQGSNSVFTSYAAALSGVPAVSNQGGASNLTATTAYLLGSLVSTGAAPVTAVAVYWDTNDWGQTTNGWPTNFTYTGNQVPGPYSTYVSGLLPNTTYYYRYMAQNLVDWGYADPAGVFFTGALTVQATTPNAAEKNQVPGVFSISRPSSTTGLALTVYYALSGTAQNGVDYSNLTGVATFAVGAATTTVTVVPIPDLLIEGPETVILTLTPGAYAIGSPSNDTVTIADGPIWYVAPPAAGSDSNPGTSWASPFATISNAVAHASPWDVVLVSNGTYAVAAQIAVGKTVAILGFSGNPADVIVTRSVSATNRIFILADPNAVLDSMTVTNGLLTDGGLTVPGAGILLTNGTVRNCVISGNVGNGGGGAGGGIYMVGGLVSNCVVRGNQTFAGWAGDTGAGIYMTSGTVTRCTIAGNYAQSSAGGNWYSAPDGGGVYMTGGTLRNSLILSNVLIRPAGDANEHDELGAGVYMTAGLLENCTIVGNKGVSGSVNVMPNGKAGSGLCQFAGTVIDCIMYFNTSANQADNYGGNLSGITYCEAPELISGAGNLGGILDPQFANAGATNFHLTAASPGLDSGTNVATDGIDLDGNPRITDGNGDGVTNIDLGCYEYPGYVATTNLTCSFSTTNATTGLDVLSNVAFTATVSGAAGMTNIVWYGWNFGAGTTPQAGPTAAVVTNTFGPGRYTVTLTVTNSLGTGTNFARPWYIQVLSDAVYASPTGTVVYPYATMATAASNLNDAVDEGIQAVNAGATLVNVYVDSGAYPLTKSIDLSTGPIQIHGAGPAQTTAYRNGIGYYRCLLVSNAMALVEGLTFTNGYVQQGQSGGIYLMQGTVRNCAMNYNQVLQWYGGAGMYMTGGTASNCTIRANTVIGFGSQGYAGGVYVAGGLLANCVIRDNLVDASSTAAANAQGGGIYMTAGAVRNCLVMTNTVKRAQDGGQSNTVSQGAGVYLAGGSLESSTIAGNIAPIGQGTAPGVSTTPYGAGVYQAAGAITNCIVYFNQATNAPDNYKASGGSIAFSCAPELTAGVSNNLSADPLFRGRATNDYRLNPTKSPCLDAGSNMAWMATLTTDLAGAPRIQGKRVDMGAYESTPVPAGALIILR